MKAWSASDRRSKGMVNSTESALRRIFTVDAVRDNNTASTVRPSRLVSVRVRAAGAGAASVGGGAGGAEGDGDGCGGVDDGGGGAE